MKKYVQLEKRPGVINDLIDKALTAPFPQIAIHHAIDKLFEMYEPDPENPSILRLKKVDKPPTT